MPKLLRSALLVLLTFALAIPAVSFAQEDDSEPTPLVIQGTLELESLLIALRDAYVEARPELDIMVDPGSGLSSGFTALCSGETDIVMSTEPISDDQIAECAANEQDFVETVLVYEAVTLVASPEAQLTCVPLFQLQDLWQLGAVEEPTWVELGSELDTPIMFYGPADADPTHRLFSTLVPASALRDDIENVAPADILAAVQEADFSVLGFMSQAEFSSFNTGATVRPVLVQNEAGDCVNASISTLGTGSYPFGRTSYLYVNAASAEDSTVQSFMEFVLNDEAGVQAIGPVNGYTVADTGSYNYGMNNVLTLNTGRTFTRPPSPVTLTAATEGAVTIAGTPMLNDLTQPIQTSFSAEYSLATVADNVLSNDSGWAAFCAGEADMLQTTRAANDEELALCAENGIDLQTVELGHNALVLAAPASADWLECVDAEIAANIYRAGNDEQAAVAQWSELNADWPESDLLLLVPPFASGEIDFMINNLIGDLTFPFRRDALENADEAYRTVGVGNTDNGLTFVWWTEYDDITDAEVKLLGVGDECVVPTAKTLADGTYPLAYSVNLHVSRASFDNALVRAFLWHLYGDTALNQYTLDGYLGLDIEQMQLVEREDIYVMLAEYEAEMGAAEMDDSTTDDTDASGDADTSDDSGDADSDADAETDNADDADTSDDSGDADSDADADAETDNADDTGTSDDADSSE